MTKICEAAILNYLLRGMSSDSPYPMISSDFWNGLGLPSKRPKLSYQISTLAKILTGKKRVKVRSTACDYATKRPVKRTLYLGLDIIIKLKSTTNFDICAILNVLNCLTKSFEP